MLKDVSPIETLRKPEIAQFSGKSSVTINDIITGKEGKILRIIPEMFHASTTSQLSVQLFDASVSSGSLRQMNIDYNQNNLSGFGATMGNTAHPDMLKVQSSDTHMPKRGFTLLAGQSITIHVSGSVSWWIAAFKIIEEDVTYA